ELTAVASGRLGDWRIPQLRAVNAVIGREEEMPAGHGEIRRIGAGAARVDVRDEDGAGGRAVALPQLAPVRPIVGHEKERAFGVEEVAGVGAAGNLNLSPATFGVAVGVVGPAGTFEIGRCRAAGVDVLDQDRPGVRSVALPQLTTVLGVLGR